MSGKARKPRTSKPPLKSVGEQPVQEQSEEGFGYLSVNQQVKAEALLQRLSGLEVDHFKHTAFAEEEAALGNTDAAAEILRQRAVLEQRIEFVRGKMQEIGVVFGAPPEADAEGDTEEQGAEG